VSIFYLRTPKIKYFTSEAMTISVKTRIGKSNGEILKKKLGNLFLSKIHVLNWQDRPAAIVP